MLAFIFALYLLCRFVYPLSYSRFPNHNIKIKVPLAKAKVDNAFLKSSSKCTSINHVSVVDMIELPRIDIYFRKYVHGIWVRSHGFPANSELLQLFQQLESYSDNIEVNNFRSQMDSIVSSHLFGSEIDGERNYLINLQRDHIQLKKLKHKDIEIGYKLVMKSDSEINSEFDWSGEKMISPKEIYSLLSNDRQREATQSMRLFSSDKVEKYDDQNIEDYYSIPTKLSFLENPDLRIGKVRRNVSVPIPLVLDSAWFAKHVSNRENRSSGSTNFLQSVSISILLVHSNKTV